METQKNIEKMDSVKRMHLGYRKCGGGEVKPFGPWFHCSDEKYKFDFESGCWMNEKSLKLFTDYAIDSGYWSGKPLVAGNVGRTRADRGTLNLLKKMGLMTTAEDSEPGEARTFWITFTESGKKLAEELGHEIEDEDTRNEIFSHHWG